MQIDVEVNGIFSSRVSCLRSLNCKWLNGFKGTVFVLALLLLSLIWVRQYHESIKTKLPLCIFWSTINTVPQLLWRPIFIWYFCPSCTSSFAYAPIMKTIQMSSFALGH